MHCFITGVSGFIGSTTAKLLLARGHTVSGLTSNESAMEPLRTMGISPVLGDLRQPQKWISHLSNADAVIHLATLPIPARPGNRYVQDLNQVQQSVTRQMLTVLSPECKVFIYTSGISVYGNTPGNIDETSQINPCRIAVPYASGEKIALNAFKKEGRPVMVLRPAGVYGFGGVFGRFWAGPMIKGKRAVIPGNGKQLFSFIHIEDCANAYVRSVETPKPGEIFNISDDEPVPLGVMIRSLAAAMNAPSPFNIPPFLFNLMAGPIVGELLLNNKMASNLKMKEKLQAELKYPTYREGISALAKGVRNPDS